MKHLKTQPSSNIASRIFMMSLVTLGALGTGCAPAFEASKTASCAAGTGCNGSLGGGGTGGGGTGGTSSGWESIDLGGSINGGRFDRAKVIDVDKVAKQLIIRLPFIAGVQLGVQAPIPIPEIPGATIGIEPSTDGSSSLVLRLPLEKVLRGVDFLPKARLPNGDALPAIPEGELPSVGLSFNNARDIRGALYLSPTVVGLFVNAKFDPFIQLTLPIRDQARTRTFGYFTSIPAKAGFDGGFFLSFALPDDLARTIDDLL